MITEKIVEQLGFELTDDFSSTELAYKEDKFRDVHVTFEFSPTNILVEFHENKLEGVKKNRDLVKFLNLCYG